MSNRIGGEFGPSSSSEILFCRTFIITPDLTKFFEQYAGEFGVEFEPSWLKYPDSKELSRLEPKFGGGCSNDDWLDATKDLVL